jgi:hypothetical protein
LSFVAAAHACGVRLPIAALLIVFMGGSAVGAAAPAAAGLGSVEAALVAGLSGFGADAAPAMAAALTFRLVTYWLPIGPSLVALWLTRRYPPVPGLKPDPASPVDVLPTPVPALALALVPVPVPVNVWIRPRPAGATAYRYGVSV